MSWLGDKTKGLERRVVLFNTHPVERAECVRFKDVAPVLDGLYTAQMQAYDERSRLIAALSKLWPSHWCWHQEDMTWDPEWLMIICVHSPVGQLTWHVHLSHQKYFAHLNKGENHWDGHTTEEKYQRLEKLWALGAPGTGT